MPNRILREGILSSERVEMLNWAEEVFYRRLMSVVDDFGRYYGRPSLIRAACYPLLLEKVSDSDIEKWLSACEEAALVRVYPASDGKRYLVLLDFKQQVRAAASKYPDPLVEGSVDAEPMPSECVAVATQMNSNCKAVAHLDVSVSGDVVEKKNHARPSGHAGFDLFWKAWPNTQRKQARKTCLDKWKAKRLEERSGQIIAHVEAMKLTDKWADGFEPAPLTYLNQCRYDDEVIQSTSSESGGDEWFKRASGWLEKGREIGEEPGPNEPFPVFKARLAQILGDGPWRHAA